jgi:hypothetical protein
VNDTDPGLDQSNNRLQVIEEAHKEFDSQRLELDYVKRSRAKAECLYSNLCEGLKQSEQELIVLKKEFSDLRKGQGFKRRELWKKNEERSSHEKLRRHVEDELAIMVEEIEKRKDDLKSLELTIASIDEDRSRKEIELKRAEENLMKLLHCQHVEFDQSRKNGVEFMSSAATSTATAAETSTKNTQEHEKETLAMLSRQEEFLKFQLMSMSLSYLSSMRMLKDLKTMSSDTTSSAFLSSIETAAAAEESNAIVSEPPSNSGNRTTGVHNAMGGLLNAQESIRGPTIIQNDVVDNDGNDKGTAMPTECRSWTISHVSKWLHWLSLGKYVQVSFVYTI